MGGGGAAGGVCGQDIVFRIIDYPGIVEKS